VASLIAALLAGADTIEGHPWSHDFPPELESRFLHYRSQLAHLREAFEGAVAVARDDLPLAGAIAAFAEAHSALSAAIFAVILRWPHSQIPESIRLQRDA